MTLKSSFLVSAALVSAVGAFTAGPAVADVMPLFLDTGIPVPVDSANMQVGGAFLSFDISFADSVTGNIFIADRSNAGVDIFSGSALTFLGRATTSVNPPITVGPFTGQTGVNNTSGPDGVLTVTTNGVTTLYAGDGNSTLRVYNATNPAQPVILQSPIATSTTPPLTRVDEMAFSPANGGQVLAANNATTPAFGSLFNTTGGTSPVTLVGAPPPGNQIVIPTSLGGFPDGGLEQPAWNPQSTTPSFWISVPNLFTASNPGGVAQISAGPNGATVLQTKDFSTLS